MPNSDPLTLQDESRAATSMRVSVRDNVASSLYALLMLVGLFVAMLFVLWLTSRVWIRNAPVAPELIEPVAGGGNAMGNSRELIEPGEEEIEDFEEPQLEDTIDAVTDAVTDTMATLDTLGGEEASSTSGGGGGDSRMPGPGNGAADLIPRAQRWQIAFNASNSQTYAKQLDAFGIELAAMGGRGESIDYVANLSSPRPVRRAAPAEEEDRMYMTYRFGPLKVLDERFLQSVGIQTEGRVVMQFFSAETENRLAIVEKAYMDNKNRVLKQIQRTTFTVEAGQRANIAVRDQDLRN